jgi:hypothetical protein
MRGAALSLADPVRVLVLATASSVMLLAGACSDASGAPQPASTPCDSCHMTDFRSAPKHVGQKPTKCAVCHESYAWHPQRVAHPFYPLDGAHAKASCFDCHKGDPPLFGGTPKECVGCHRADYDRSRFPGHSSFPLTCDKCHSVSAWKPTLPSFVMPESGHHETPPAPQPTHGTSMPQPTQRKVPPKPPEPRPRSRPDGLSGASKHR